MNHIELRLYFPALLKSVLILSACLKSAAVALEESRSVFLLSFIQAAHPLCSFWILTYFSFMKTEWASNKHITSPDLTWALEDISCLRHYHWSISSNGLLHHWWHVTVQSTALSWNQKNDCGGKFGVSSACMVEPWSPEPVGVPSYSPVVLPELVSCQDTQEDFCWGFVASHCSVAMVTGTLATDGAHEKWNEVLMQQRASISVYLRQHLDAVTHQLLYSGVADWPWLTLRHDRQGAITAVHIDCSLE